MSELKDLEAIEVSLVSKAANKKKFVILKSESKGVNQMDEILKAIVESELENEKEVDKILKQKKVSEKAVIAVKGALKVLNAFKDELPKDVMNTLAELAGYGYEAPEGMAKQKAAGCGDYKPVKKADGSIDLTGVPEEVKPLLTALWKENEDMAKRANVLEAMIQKQEDDKLTDKYVQVAKQFKNFSLNPAELGAVLKDIAKKTPESVAKIEEVLKSADAAISNSGLFKEIGSAAGNSPKAMDKIEQKAVEIMKTEKITKAEAITKALESNPELYNEYLKEGGNF
jgi:hypothetical protein